MAGKHYSMAFPDSSWTRFGTLHIIPISTEEEEIRWIINGNPLLWWHEGKKLKSEDFSLVGATCNFFLLVDLDVHQFGINVRTNSSSDTVLDCSCDIKFKNYLNIVEIKHIECRFKSEKHNTHWRVEDFFSDTERDNFLQNDPVIFCKIGAKKCNIEEASSQAQMVHSNSSSTLAAPTQKQLPENHAVAFPDTAWPRGGGLGIESISAEEKEIIWYIGSFLRGCWKAREESGESLRELRSCDFPVAGATFHFFTSFDFKGSRSRLGIVRTRVAPETVFDYFFCISFQDKNDRKITEFNFKCAGLASYWEKDFLLDFELEEFLRSGYKIYCILKMKESDFKEACSQTEIPYPSGYSVVEAHTKTQQFEKEDEEFPMVKVDKKLCQDFNNLLLSEEGSDVTLQVRDHQFKVHRSILSARSSVFASMFRHDMKEKATGVVEVEDCEPSSFPVLLEFMYCGCTEKLSAENVFDLYTSADKYDVQGLKMKCHQFIINNLCVNTICETIQLSLQHSEKDLLKLATEFFIRNFQKIILTPKWQIFLTENPIQGHELLIKFAKNMSPTPH